MIGTGIQDGLTGLIERLQAMPASERRAILSRLDRADRTGIRQIIRGLKAQRGGSPAMQMLSVALERTAYSAPLKRHLRRALAGGDKSGPALTPAVSAWLTHHLSSPAGETRRAAAGGTQPPAADTRSTVRLAAVSGGRKTGSGQY